MPLLRPTVRAQRRRGGAAHPPAPNTGVGGAAFLVASDADGAQQGITIGPLDPAAASVAQGASVDVTVPITRQGGYAGTITLEPSGLPADVTPTWPSGNTAADGVPSRVLRLTPDADAALVTNDSYTITASASGVSNSVANGTVSVTGVSAFTPNQPAWATGGTLITDTRFGNMVGFEQLSPDGIATTTDSNNTIANINNNTQSDGPWGTTAYRTFYPGGDPGAGTGGTTIFDYGNRRWRRVYFAIEVKVDSFYRLHATGGEKFFYPVLDGSSCMLNWALLPGSGQTALGTTWGFYLQPQVGDSNRYQDLNGVYMTKGVWNRVEVEMIVDTPGSNNGVLRVWINGVNAINWTNVNYSTRGTQDAFDGIRFNGVRGGPADSGNVPAGGQSRYYNRLALYATTTG